VLIWSDSSHLLWTKLSRHLCVFANGRGDLSMLLPPLRLPDAGPGDLRRSLGEAFEVMDAYNDVHATRSHSRIHYVSDELLEAVYAGAGKGLQLGATPTSGDYIYPVGNMVDLAGGMLKSKRHARSKFMRDYPDHRIETLEDQHLPACLALLDAWQHHANDVHEGQLSEDDSHVPTTVLRQSEASACRLALRNHRELKLKGLVLFVGETLVGFTLGEALSPAQASILIEKTHPDYHGAAQFIFSEFCRLCWANYPQINVGDDWGIPTLRFTKESYRPSRRLNKYMLARPVGVKRVFACHTMRRNAMSEPMNDRRGVQAGAGGPTGQPSRLTIRRAVLADVQDILTIEHCCFELPDAFSRRQIRDLITNDRVICRVAVVDEMVAAWCVGFARQFRHHRSGRIYNLAVDPNFRGRGVAKKLLKHVVDELAQLGSRYIYLEVRSDNSPAVRLYEQFGFRAMRPLRNYYGERLDGMSMRMTISEETAKAQPAREEAAAYIGDPLAPMPSETGAAVAVPAPIITH
jgi:hypothetical protein